MEIKSLTIIKKPMNNLGVHGVRKYDYETGRFNSPDVLWEKYRGWNSYQYCMNNPIWAKDWDGRELIIVGDKRAGMSDLDLLVGIDNSNRLSLNDNGRVNVNQVNYEIGSSKELDLIIDLSNATEKIGYEATNFKMINDMNGTPYEPFPIMNRSSTHFYKGMPEESLSNNPPESGFDGTVKININALFFFSKDEANNKTNEQRKTVIGHELMENYYRTVGKMNYFEAHDKSNLNFWGGSDEKRVSIR